MTADDILDAPLSADEILDLPDEGGIVSGGHTSVAPPQEEGYFARHNRQFQESYLGRGLRQSGEAIMALDKIKPQNIGNAVSSVVSNFRGPQIAEELSGRSTPLTEDVAPIAMKGLDAAAAVYRPLTLAPGAAVAEATGSDTAGMLTELAAGGVLGKAAPELMGMGKREPVIGKPKTKQYTKFAEPVPEPVAAEVIPEAVPEAPTDLPFTTTDRRQKSPAAARANRQKYFGPERRQAPKLEDMEIPRDAPPTTEIAESGLPEVPSDARQTAEIYDKLQKHKANDPFAVQKEMQAFPGFTTKVIEAIRNSPMTETLKTKLGTKWEKYEAQLGETKGKAAAAEEIAYEVARDKGRRDAIEFSKVLQETMPAVEQKTAFHASEAIKGLDDQGNPIFGTVEPETLGGGVRYTEQEGQQLWTQLSPASQNAIKWWVGEREILHTQNNILGHIQGYIHHFKDVAKKGFLDKAAEFVGAKPVTEEMHPTGVARGVKLKHAKMPQERQRGGDPDIVQNFGKAVEKYLVDANDKQTYNAFIDKFAQLVTEPAQLDPATGRVPRGYKIIEPYQSTRTAAPVGQLGSGRMIKKDLYNNFVRHVEAIQETNDLRSLGQDIANFYRVNLLAYEPSTVATNAISGGLQYTLKYVDDFWHGILTGDVKKTGRNTSALFTAFTKVARKAVPAEAFGAKSNIRTQFGPPESGLSKVADFGMRPFGAVENYWKRVIALSEMEKGTPLKADVLLHNKAELFRINKIIDSFAYNYNNIPEGLRAFRDSPLGAGIIPFPVYFYKLSRMYGRYMAAFNPVAQMSKADRYARMLTVATVAMAVAPLALRSNEKTRKAGRTAIGGDEGLRTVKYPLINATNPMALAKEGISTGPIAEAGIRALGYEGEYDRGKTAGAIAGNAVSSVMPLGRLTESGRSIIAAAQGEQNKQPQTFGQAIARKVPGIPSLGKPKGRRPELNLEVLKFMTGINIQRGHHKKPKYFQ